MFMFRILRNDTYNIGKLILKTNPCTICEIYLQSPITPTKKMMVFCVNVRQIDFQNFFMVKKSNKIFLEMLQSNNRICPIPISSS